ncbi:cytochrome P450 76A1-like [Eucalyptus grandis]|uniref:cytochrome P450 76A1-like n=1 Tax=Eucalyptus grandis TaxID=71139 RepID=UPI00192EB3D6|nr:cytochrome P450 76A1-like [Eucalyptus grandis]
MRVEREITSDSRNAFPRETWGVVQENKEVSRTPPLTRVEREVTSDSPTPSPKSSVGLLIEAKKLEESIAPKAPRRAIPRFSEFGASALKGSNIFLNEGYIHRDPMIWDKPTEFRPKRFLEDPSKYDLLGNDFTHLPFGSGRRICAWLALTERMLTFSLASLLHSFEWELPQEVELELSDKFGIVVKKLNPPVAIPRPRLSIPKLYMSR